MSALDMGIRLHVVPSSRVPGPKDASATPTRWEFAQPRVVIGRAAGSDVVLPHPSASARHASIEADGPRYTIVDHGSLNGTWVNGRRLAPDRRTPLRDGDQIVIGLFELLFEANVAVRDVASREHTSALARRLLRELRSVEPGRGPRLTLTNGPARGRVFELPPPPARLVVGRDEGAADIVVPDGDASRKHAEVVIDAEGVTVRDIGSKNGLFVGEQKVVERRLTDRDELRIGATVLLFEDAATPSLASIEAMDEEPVAPPEPTPMREAPRVEATGEGQVARPSESSSPPVASVAPEAVVAGPPPLDADADAPAAPEPGPEQHPTSRRGKAALAPGELAVYVLAAAVFAASAAGLWWLVR